MKRNESEGRADTPTAVPQDRPLPAGHNRIPVDQKTSTAYEHGTHQHPSPPKICDYVLSDRYLGLFVFAFRRKHS